MVTLTAFDKTDSISESAAGFAESMRNPLDPQGARQREIKRQVDAAVAARGKAMQAREDAVALREAAAANSTGGSGTGTDTGSPPTINPPGRVCNRPVGQFRMEVRGASDIQISPCPRHVSGEHA